MSKIKLNIFELASLSWIAISAGALLFALLDVFLVGLNLLWISVVVASCVILVRNKTIALQPLKINEFILLCSLCALALVLSLSTTPTIFGGRDEGSFSNSAIMLSNDQSLSHESELIQEFFDIHGPGKALNFPGFYFSQDGRLVSQFLPGYASWVGLWYSFFGSSGIKFANFLPFVTFVFAFFSVAKHFVGNKKYAYWGAAVLALMLPTIVFFKFTLTEIYFGALLWLSIHFLLNYFRHRSYPNYVLAFLPLVLAPFVRIEALGVAFAMILVIIGADFANAKVPRYQMMFLVLGLSITASLFTSPHFFVDSFKNVFEFTLPSGPETGAAADKSFLPDDWQSFYLLKIFFNYNILPLLLMGAAMIGVLAWKKKWELLVPFFLLSPTLIYLADANISLDHPWMLRRFLFTIIPLLLLYATYLLFNASFKFPTVATVVLAILAVLIFAQSAQFLLTSQNRGLLAQARSIAESFGPQDLVLVSQKSSGSGWSLICEPLRNIDGLNAVYFFDPQKLSQIELEKFNNVYLITSIEEEELFKDLPKRKLGQYLISNSITKPSLDPTSYPRMESYQADGTVYQINIKDDGTN